MSLTRKLYFVVSLMALLIATELFTLSFMVNTLSSTRALVGAEGLWSKAEKDAVYSLTKYGYTHDEKDYQRYLQLLAVPLGDHQARLELLKANPDLNIVRKGFEQGRVHPDDIDGSVKLLRRFHNISYISKAIDIWTQGDYYIGILQYLGTRLHTQVSIAGSSPENVSQTQNEIYLLNEKLTLLEDDFSFTLGEGSRWVEGLVLKILFLIAITVEFTGLFLTISVSRSISKGINEIIQTADTVSQADLTHRAKVFSNDEIGKLAHSFNNMIDDLQKKIEEEKRTEDELREQKDLYETLIKTESEMGQGVSITENEKIIYVNEAVCRIYGYSKDEILKMRSFLDIVPEDEKPKLIERLKQRSEGKREQSSGETIIIRKDGRPVHLEYTVRNIIVDGRIQVLSIIRDVTEKKKAEEQLNRERQRAESAEIAKKVGEQFLANMSHEIRTPMNAIIGFTDIIMNTQLTPEQQQYLEAIRMSGENLLVIINDILDFSRMRSGKIPIEKRGFKLSRVVSMCVELMHPKADEKGISISYHIDENIPDELVGDATRLNQVLLNLSANAIKFTSKGEVTLKVKVLSETKDDVALEFAVNDTGIGIPKDKLALIFEAFTQAEKDTARRYGGTGLGLAIVKQLAELQGGSVDVTSEEGKGSCFYFRIKYKKSTRPVLQSKEKKNGHDRKVKGLNILLVEDNNMNQLLAKKVLTDWGWHVETAENGVAAIEKVKGQDFDVVLMDIQMPGMDGYEATRQIRNNIPEPKRHVPIMAMTAHVMTSEEQECYNMGMNDYISKPFDTDILYEKITSLARKTPKIDNN